jgi:hypothetical protein
VTKKQLEERVTYLEAEIARLHKTIQEMASKQITILPAPAPLPQPDSIPWQPCPTIPYYPNPYYTEPYRIGDFPCGPNITCGPNSSAHLS